MKKKIVTLYLAHNTEERFFVKNFIQPALEKEGIRVINPFLNRKDASIFFEEKYRSNKNLMKLVTREQKRFSPKKIVSMEVAMLNHADGLIAYMPYPGVGTSMEILTNSKVLKRGAKKTFIFTPNHYLLKHPWLQMYATPSDDLKQLIKIIKKQFKV